MIPIHFERGITMPDSSIFTTIQKCYVHFTTTEKIIADFFLENKEKKMLTARHVSRELNVSEASLSRFAQKMGYHGYREFLYLYEAAQNQKKALPNAPSPSEAPPGEKKMTAAILPPSGKIFSIYENILTRTAATVDNKHLEKISTMLCKADQVFVYGLGNSGLAAMEFELRMLKIGIDIKAFTDYHQMVLNETRLKKGSLAIGITLSAQTAEIRDALLSAAAKNARTLCITAGQKTPWLAQVDEVLTVSTIKGLEYGNMVSPMLPLLLNLDLLYAFCLLTKKKQDDDQKDDEHALWERLKRYHDEAET